MGQESGDSMIAVSGMDARAGTWPTNNRRNTRRIGVVASLALAFGAGGLGLIPGGAAAHTGDEITLTVTTTRDIVPETSDSNSNVNMTKVELLSACLANQGNQTGGGAYPTLSGSTGTPAWIEDQVDGQDTDPSTPGTKDPARPDSNNVQPCSLRMALHLAAILSPQKIVDGVDNATATKVNIEIGRPNPNPSDIQKGDLLEISPGVKMDLTRATLAIRGGNVSINGCGMGASTTPCVNLRFGKQPVNVPFGDSTLEGLPGLIALADNTTIKGIAFQGGRGPAILQPPVVPVGNSLAPGRLTVQNSWFGIAVDRNGNFVTQKYAGTQDSFDPPPIGIQLSGNGTLSGDRSLIGGSAPGQGNVFATYKSETMTGILVAGSSLNRIEGNRFGSGPDGRVSSSLAVTTGIRLTGLTGANASRIVGSTSEAINSPTGADTGYQTPAINNLIGGEVEEGGVPASSGCVGKCNVFINAKDVAIDVGGPAFDSAPGVKTDRNTVGASGTRIESNRIGLDALGAPGTNKNGGIVVRNGSRKTTIGGPSPFGFGNVISFNGSGSTPGVLVAGTFDNVFEDGAGDGTRFQSNIGRGNRGGILKLGNEQVSGGVEPPVVESVQPTSVTGSASPGSTVNIYYVDADAKQGDITSVLAEATAGPDGGWSASINAQPGGSVTATQTVLAGTSELAPNVAVPVPPRRDDPPVTPPKNPTDPPSVKTVLGQDPEQGPVVVTTKSLKTLGGQVEDPAGTVSRVRIALQVLRVTKAKRAKRAAAAKQKACRFVHLRKASLVSKPCDRPPYRVAELRVAQSGDTAWQVPLDGKLRKRLKPGRYRLLVELTDTNGAVAVHRVPLVIKPAKGKRG